MQANLGFRFTMLRRLAPLAALVAIVAIAGPGCKSAPKTDDPTSINDGSASPDSENIPSTMDENTMGDSDSGKAMGLQTINFPYDSFVLDGSARGTLKQNIQIMKDNPNMGVQVEGHCDTRGGIQYNIALGEKRANAVRKYMIDNGVAGNRLTTISYGKERLLDSGMGEDAHNKNRRANFVITSK